MLEKIITLIVETLELDDIDDITMDTTMDDVLEWDSFGQVALMAAIEKTFDVKLTADDMIEMNSVEGILEILEQKKN